MKNTSTTTKTTKTETVETFDNVEMKTLTWTEHFTFGDVTTVTVWMRRVGQDNWVEFLHRVD